MPVFFRYGRKDLWNSTDYSLSSPTSATVIAGFAVIGAIRPRVSSLDFIKASVIPIIEQYRIPLVLITGGEPALHPDLPELARNLKRTGATITLITNGSHLDTLYPRLEDSIDALLLSLDTPNADLHRRTRGLVNFHQLLQYPAMIKKRNPLKQEAFSCLLQKRNI